MIAKQNLRIVGFGLGQHFVGEIAAHPVTMESKPDKMSIARSLHASMGELWFREVDNIPTSRAYLQIMLVMKVPRLIAGRHLQELNTAVSFEINDQISRVCRDERMLHSGTSDDRQDFLYCINWFGKPKFLTVVV
jgi:hypothetical protein